MLVTIKINVIFELSCYRDDLYYERIWNQILDWISSSERKGEGAYKIFPYDEDGYDALFIIHSSTVENARWQLEMFRTFLKTIPEITEIRSKGTIEFETLDWRKGE